MPNLYYHVLSCWGPKVAPGRNERVTTVAESIKRIYPDATVDLYLPGNIDIDNKSKEDAASQLGDSGWKDVYSRSAQNRFESQLAAQPNAYHVLVATESWHSYTAGPWLNDPSVKIVEPWIDYIGSFAPYRGFTSRALMLYEAGRVDALRPSFDWRLTRPALSALAPIDSDPNSGIVDVDQLNPFNLSFLRAIAEGKVVVAPDWGAWSEFLQCRHTALLYLSLAGRRSSIDNHLDKIDKSGAAEWVKMLLALEHVDADLAELLNYVNLTQ